MTNPILRRLSRPGTTGRVAADLLAKHIGPGTNEAHCRQAVEALQRMKDRDTVLPARVVAALTASDKGHCAAA